MPHVVYLVLPRWVQSTSLSDNSTQHVWELLAGNRTAVPMQHALRRWIRLEPIGVSINLKLNDIKRKWHTRTPTLKDTNLGVVWASFGPWKIGVETEITAFFFIISSRAPKKCFDCLNSSVCKVTVPKVGTKPILCWIRRITKKTPNKQILPRRVFQLQFVPKLRKIWEEIDHSCSTSSAVANNWDYR